MESIIQLSDKASLRIDLFGGYTYDLRDYPGQTEADFTVFVKSGGTIDFTVKGSQEIDRTRRKLENALKLAAA